MSDHCDGCGKPVTQVEFGGLYIAPDGRCWPYVLCRKCTARLRTDAPGMLSEVERRLVAPEVTH